MSNLVQHVLEANACSQPDALALVCGDRRLTYLELETEANRLANALQESGVKRGDRVVILLRNSFELVVAIFGTLKVGAVFVVLHSTTKPAQLTHILNDAAPAALIAEGLRVGSSLETITASGSVTSMVWVGIPPVRLAAHGPGPSPISTMNWSDLANYPDEPPTCGSIDADLATLIYTSGSTGQAKGVMSTHLNVLTATTSINGYLQNTTDDVIIDVLPLAFDYGLFQVFLAFQAGGRLVLEQGFAFPAHTVSVMETEGVTGFPGVPTIFAMLLKYPELLMRPLPALRYITNTAAALPMRHIRELQAAFPGVRIFSMYGLTECKRVSYLPPEQLGRRPLSVGIAIPNTEVYVADEDGKRLPAGQIGELVIRGSHVTRGYWHAPELTVERFRPGPLQGETVLYSGDLFTMDDDGFLYFVARKDEIIKSRGEKVSPREVENAVYQLEGVAEVAATSVPDDLLGEAILIAVVPRKGAGLTETDLRAHCARSLEDFKVPKYVIVTESLPRTENGKVDRLRLRADVPHELEPT
jgi:amino acid adenylation domain-containing protein